MAEIIIRKREDIPEEFKWKLEDMFATDEQWEHEYEKALALAKELSGYQGKLGRSAEALLSFLTKSDELSFYTDRLYVYANERYHQDTKVSKYQGLAAKAERMIVEISSATAFEVPEILAIPEAKMKEFFQEEPKLVQYRRRIDEIYRGKEHTLSPEMEELLAEAGDLAVAPSNIFDMINDADIHFHSIADVEGNRIPVSHGNFIVLQRSKDRSLRRHAYRSVYQAYQKWGNTIATTFVAHLKQEHFFAKARHYASTRAMHLHNGNIPESVYDKLIESVHKHLPALHRYVTLRKKRMGLERLHMYDMYIPLVDAVEKEYTYEEAKAMVVEALAPMGEEYLSVLQSAFAEGWVDVYENENKRSGAYSWAAYGTHPYVLMNYQGNLDSVFTLAHEMGHAMHSYFSNKSQPITYSQYLIFVAEVASTCNESLLMRHMLEHTQDEKEKQYLINHYLEQFRTTLFRQASFAEFEHIVHTKLAAGEALTKDDLCAIYHGIIRDYYGDDLYIDSELDYEWMRIPHFYTSYYVYQYATGYSAAIAFSDKILQEGAPAVEQYINHFLCGGCSKDPIQLLADAGVDMSTPKPVDDALNIFEKYLEEFEKQMS